MSVSGIDLGNIEETMVYEPDLKFPEETHKATIGEKIIENVGRCISQTASTQSHQFSLLSPNPVQNQTQEEVFFEYLNWILETGLWDGRPISVEEASNFQKQVEERILSFITSLDPESHTFRQSLAQLALMGAKPEDRARIEQEIDALGLKNAMALPIGGIWHCMKKTGRWINDHKVEITIGVVTVAATVTIIVLTGGTAAPAAQAAAALGCAALDTLSNGSSSSNLPPLPTPTREPIAPIQMPSFSADIFKQDPIPEPFSIDKAYPIHPNTCPNSSDWLSPISRVAEKSPTPPERSFLENGIMMDGKFTSYRELLQELKYDEFLKLAGQYESSNFNHPKPSPNSASSIHIDTSSIPRSQEPVIETTMTSDSSSSPSVPVPEKTPSFLDQIKDFASNLGRGLLPEPYRGTSRRYETPGVKNSHMAINFMNGINTKAEEALSHVEYLAKFTPTLSVGLVYNQTHSAIVDGAEAFGLNYAGFSPNTAKIKRQEWIEFHELNKDNPNAKILEISHSQGGIDIRNALEKCSKEIRERVIVVNVGTAAIIPKRLCFDSYNYACEGDLVNKVQFLYTLLFSRFHLKQFLEDRKELIFLKPHPDSTGMGHSFQDPTFKNVLKTHIDDYIRKKGQYSKKETELNEEIDNIIDIINIL